MPIELSREALLAFRDRRWDLVREAKESFWAHETRTRGPDAGFAAGEALWVHARSIDPAWPTETSRRADLAHHVEMNERIQRIARALAGR